MTNHTSDGERRVVGPAARGIRAGAVALTAAASASVVSWVMRA